jgi:alpha-D-xyloside xylohydrolase
VLGREVVCVEAWGVDCIRVQASVSGRFAPIEEALVAAAPTPAVVRDLPDAIEVVNGALTAVVESSGRISFRRTGSEVELCGEPPFDPREPPTHAHRRFRSPVRGESGHGCVEATFAAYDGERIHGLGQHPDLPFDLKGSVVELLQRNSHVSIPVALSSRGYGFFWNCPSIGRVEFAHNATRWIADHATQIDYVVFAGDTPALLMQRYAELTGFPPALPWWATGYWQSNSYYPSQDELLAVAREHLDRGLPLTSMFVDYMHWSHLGNWDWDTERWPDPSAMVSELARREVRVMVAVWPHVSPLSDHHADLARDGLLATDGQGSLARFDFADRAVPEGIAVSLLDLTSADARRFYWQRIAEHHHRIGVQAYWLDACEPEITGDGINPREESVHFAAGPGGAVSSMFPMFDARALREGLTSVGATDSMLLARSAWAGSQRYGVAVWSGDITSTWSSLRQQCTAGLNMMASGMPWWTSDIGGFFLARRESDEFRELLIRWFQFAVCWPIVRMHGNRHDNFYDAGIFSAGGPNEVWSFGAQVEDALTQMLHFRERIRPLVHELCAATSVSGLPPVRPMWMQFPDESDLALVDDQFMLGDDVLVAPVLQFGARSREVALPQGRWRDVWIGTMHEGPGRIVVDAPVDRLPIFERAGSPYRISPSWCSAAD